MIMFGKAKNEKILMCNEIISEHLVKDTEDFDNFLKPE